MPNSSDDDPTVPPPGNRSGSGTNSIMPFLKKSLAVKPQVPTHPDDMDTGPGTRPGDDLDSPG